MPTKKKIMCLFWLMLLATLVAAPSCKPAITQTADAQTSHMVTAMDIPIKAPSPAATKPAEVKQETAKPDNRFGVFALLYTLCIEPQAEEPLVASPCIDKVGACWLKLKPEQQVDPVQMIGCAKQYFAERPAP